MLRPILILAVVAGVLLLDACGGGAGGDGDDTSAGLDDGETATGDATTGGEPPADDPDAVRPHLEDLLADYDRVVNQIMTDPGVAADRDDALVQEYLSLFEPDSRFAEDVIDGWVATGEEGVSLHPYSAEHPTTDTSLDGEIEVVSDDEVVVPTCVEQRYVVHEDGRVTEGVPLKEQPGEVVVVRVDGEWLLRRRDVFENVTECDGGGR